MRAQRGFAVTVLVVGLVMLSGAASASARWTIQSTVASDGDTMTGVSCPGMRCMAVLGNSGEAASQFFNGHSWSVKPVPNPARGIGPMDNFSAVSCTSANACTAVGNYGHVSQELPLVERWNGHRWSVQHTRTGFLGRGGFGTLTGVSCPSARSCTAVGYRGGSSRTGHTFLVAEGWNGSRWTPEPVPERDPVLGSTAVFTGVSCSSASACTAVGAYGDFGHQNPLAARWNGRRWSLEHMAATPHATSILNSVSCPSATDCVAVGQHRHAALLERWNGRRWSVHSGPDTGDVLDSLGGVSCSSPGACMAVGYSQTSRAQVLLAERWNGRRWTVQRPPNVGGNGDSLDSVWCPSGGSCTAVGDYSVEQTCNSTTCFVPDPLAERWTR